MEFEDAGDLFKKLNQNNYKSDDSDNEGSENKGTGNNIKEDKQSNHKTKIPIRKFTANGRIALHESVIIDTTPRFVTINKNKEVEFKTEVETPDGEIFIPNDTIYTQNPLPYVFESEEEFKQYMDYASKLDLDSLFSLVETEFRKYVDVEGYYYTLLTGDTILSHFQDIFPFTHYVIITGDNDAGKNSALLVYRYLGYRVFYVTSASAPNYYTVLGNREEGQVTIAEDEADDLTQDRDKIKVLKTGYTTGGNVPKVELERGRRSDNWLTYCHKWLAMEEMPDDRKMKGILDRSLVLKFVTGNPKYNIKEVIRSGKDPEYEPLFKKLMHIRKLVFCFRLLHYEDQFLNVKLNIKNRTAELANPLIRLFRKSPLTKQRILDDLSRFINERNENKKNSFEAKLYNVITQLIEDRKELIKKGTPDETELKVLGTHIFSNEIIRDACKNEMDGRNIEGKDTAFYSTEFGTVSQKKITSTLKSKFKVDPPRLYRIGYQVLRCVEFKQEYLDKIKAYYDMPNQIEIIEDRQEPKGKIETELVTDVTDITLSGRVDIDLRDDSEPENSQNINSPAVNEPKIVQDIGPDIQCTTVKAENTPTEFVTCVTSVTEHDGDELT